MFAAFGDATAGISITFVSGAAAVDDVGGRPGLAKRCVPVSGTREVTKAGCGSTTP